MCTGHMGNQVFEIVEEVLETTQEEIISKQMQLGQKGLNDLVEVIEKLGYKRKITTKTEEFVLTGSVMGGKI